MLTCRYCNGDLFDVVVGERGQLGRIGHFCVECSTLYTNDVDGVERIDDRGP